MTKPSERSEASETDHPDGSEESGTALAFALELCLELDGVTAALTDLRHILGLVRKPRFARIREILTSEDPLWAVTGRRLSRNSRVLYRVLRKFPLLMIRVLPRALTAKAETEIDEKRRRHWLILAESAGNVQRRFPALDAFRQTEVLLAGGRQLVAESAKSRSESQSESESEIRAPVMLLWALEMFTEAVERAPANAAVIQGTASCCVGEVCLQLAGAGVDAPAYFEQAGSSYERAAERLGKKEERAYCLLEAAIARLQLGDLEIDPVTNYPRAAVLARRAAGLAQSVWGHTKNDMLARCNLRTAEGLLRQAGLGVEPHASLQEALQRSQAAAEYFQRGRAYAGGMLLHGDAWFQLAMLEPAPSHALERALETYMTAAVSIPPGPEQGVFFLKVGNTHQMWGDLTVDTPDQAAAHYQSALNFFEKAVKFRSRRDGQLATCVLNQGITCGSLAELGVRPLWHYHRALYRVRQAAFLFQGGPGYMLALRQAAGYLTALADLGRKPLINLRRVTRIVYRMRMLDPNLNRDRKFLMTAATVYEKIAACAEDPVLSRDARLKASRYLRCATAVTENPALQVDSLFREALVHECLAQEDDDEIRHWERVLSVTRAMHKKLRLWTRESRSLHINNDLDSIIEYTNVSDSLIDGDRRRLRMVQRRMLGLCWMLEANARMVLGQRGVGIAAREQYFRAAQRFCQAARLFSPQSPDHVRCLVGEGLTRRFLGRHLADPRAEYERGLELFQRAAVISDDERRSMFCLEEQGNFHFLLAAAGVTPRKDLERALEIHEQIGEHFPDRAENAQYWAKSGLIHRTLAEHMIDPAHHLAWAVLHIHEAAQRSEDEEELMRFHYHEGIARLMMAHHGIEPAVSYQTAISLFEHAYNAMATPLEQAQCRLNLGYAWLGLADQDPKAKSDAHGHADGDTEGHADGDTDGHADGHADADAETRLEAAANQFQTAGAILETQVANNVNESAESDISEEYQEIMSLQVRTWLSEAMVRERLLALPHPQNAEERPRWERLSTLYGRALEIVEEPFHRAFCLQRYASAALSLSEYDEKPHIQLEQAMTRFRNAYELLNQVRGKIEETDTDPDNREIPREVQENARAETETASVSKNPQEDRIAVLRHLNRQIGACLLGEGEARFAAGRLEEDPQESLEHVILLNEQAYDCFEAGPEAARCLIGQAAARLMLAKARISPEDHLKAACRAYEKAATLLTDPVEIGQCLFYQGVAQQHLSWLGHDARMHLDQAVLLYEDAAKRLGTGPEAARCWLNLANARKELAEKGVDSQRNWRQSVRLSRRVANLFPEGANHAAALMACGVTRLDMVRWELSQPSPDVARAVNRLRCARRLFQNAAAGFGDGAGRLQCRYYEAEIRIHLAELDHRPVPNLKRAAALFQQLSQTLSDTMDSMAVHVFGIQEAVARIQLAEHGVAARRQLQRALRLLENAGARLEDGPLLARAWMHEANARLQLAELGAETINNLTLAQAKSYQAFEIFGEGREAARCLRNARRAREQLAALGISAPPDDDADDDDDDFDFQADFDETDSEYPNDDELTDFDQSV